MPFEVFGQPAQLGVGPFPPRLAVAQGSDPVPPTGPPCPDRRGGARDVGGPVGCGDPQDLLSVGVRTWSSDSVRTSVLRRPAAVRLAPISVRHSDSDAVLSPAVNVPSSSA